MSKNVINIAFCLDSNFIKQLSVTIVSILLNAEAEDEFSFYVLCDGISKEDKDKIIEIKKQKKIDIQFIEIKNEEFKNCPLSLHFAKANYFRIKLPALINLDKILYLDCDIIVRKSLNTLYNQDINDKYAAVVADTLSKEGFLDKHLKRLNVENYFNSGVMLMNLKKMRQDNVEEKFFNFVKNHSEKIKYVDQCVFNVILNNKIKFLDVKYNFQHNSGVEKMHSVYKKNKKDIVILHFTGCAKPWLYNKQMIFTFEYFYYLSKTPFGGGFCGVIFNEIKNNVCKKIYKTIRFAVFQDNFKG